MSQEILFLQKMFINALISENFINEAEIFIKQCNFDINEFPLFLKKLQFKGIKHFLTQDNMPIVSLLDLIADDELGIATLIDCLLGLSENDLWINRIVSYLLKKHPNSLQYIKELSSTKFIEISSTKYTPKVDEYGPRNLNHAHIPELPVYFISSEQDLASINWTNTFIVSLDSEWKIGLGKSNSHKTSILQIALPSQVYIIDLLALNKSIELDDLLFKLFTSQNILKLGINFENDLCRLKNCYPDMKCFKAIVYNYLDLIHLHKKYYNKDPGGLASLVEIHLNVPLCKFEQKSNWELRPLRLSQYHYAALDAYICLVIYEKYREKEVNFANFTINIGVKNVKNYNGCLKYLSCNECNSKLHRTEECCNKLKCRICGEFGHFANNCPCFTSESK